MDRLIDSHFFRIYNITNSMLLTLGAGAVFLISENYRKRIDNFDDDKEFGRHLEDLNTTLVKFERILYSFEWENRKVTGNRDDDNEFLWHDSKLNRIDVTLSAVELKIHQLRKSLKAQQSRNSYKDSIAKEESDSDSFQSAASGIDDEVNEGAVDDFVRKKALSVAGAHRDKEFYLMGLEEYFRHGVRCRKNRTKIVGCASEIEYLAKVHCIRKASKVVFSKENVRLKLEKHLTYLLKFLITTANRDHVECEKRWKALLEFCKNSQNFNIMENELKERHVPYQTFYDVVLDFILMDAFTDLENPPYSVQVAVQNSWLPAYVQRTALETAVWGVLKAKIQILEEPAGFLMHFYRLSEIVTPALAWGF
ncbi:mitoguardin-like isoform X2 [Xenia sp. Carnegie-2017]|uniref:mitoguardin-like isoform X2 n=1 Tax=Xenia sp. Carnegie-2017 TaxID=2897299 RepID=UPI001F0402FD|nr:mitoguardin-like isoform X2 [Xenia sp. Carnegie-2017]